jgi:hypothetical protein
MATERENVERIQQALAVIKASLREIQDINTKAGADDPARLDAANAAYGFFGQFICLHSEMTEAMRKYWPEFASEVQAFGPRR